MSHGGEDHSEDKKQEVKEVVQKIETETFENVINTKNGTFKVIIEKTPKTVYQGDNVDIKFYTSEIIENSFIEPENIKLKNITINIPGSKSIDFKDNIKSHANNIYSFQRVFNEQANITLNLTDINNNSFSTNLNINVIKLPVNYLSYTLIIIILIILIIYTAIFLKRDIHITKKAVFILLNILIGLISVLLIKNAIPLKIKPEVQEVKNDNILSNNEVFVSKETQLLFDIQTQEVTKKNINNSINIFGTLKPYNQDKGDIITPVSGRVYLNNVSLGQFVNKNQVLGYIEQTLDLPSQLAVKTNAIDLKLKILDLESRANVSQNNVNNAKAEYERSKIDLNAKNTEQLKEIEKVNLNIDLAQKEYIRVQELYKTGSASLKRLQEAENSLKVLKTELESLKNRKTYTIGSEPLKRLREAELQLNNNRQELELARKQLNEINSSDINVQNKKFNLVSPISGIITQINTTNGNQEEQNKLIINIVNNQKMLIEGEVLEKDISKIANSRTGEFKVNSYPGKVFKIDGLKNKFITLGNSIDSEKRTIPVIFEIDNINNTFKEGMFADISLNISNKSENIIIPKSSLSQEDGKYFVYVYKNPELFEKRDISLINQNIDYVSVASGLEEGEKVASQGIYQLNALMIGKK